MVTVACTKRDPKAFTIQKYNNNEPWNVPGGTAPSGVHATRYLRKTDPDTSQLSPLARFLVENCPACVAGTMPHPNPSAHVVCYNGKSYEWGGVTFPEKINDWKFSIIDPDQSDTDYWNQEADKIIAAGSIRVTVANAEWRA